MARSALAGKWHPPHACTRRPSGPAGGYTALPLGPCTGPQAACLPLCRRRCSSWVATAGRPEALAAASLQAHLLHGTAAHLQPSSTVSISLDLRFDRCVTYMDCAIQPLGNRRNRSWYSDVLLISRLTPCTLQCHAVITVPGSGAVKHAVSREQLQGKVRMCSCRTH